MRGEVEVGTGGHQCHPLCRLGMSPRRPARPPAGEVGRCQSPSESTATLDFILRQNTTSPHPPPGNSSQSPKKKKKMLLSTRINSILTTKYEVGIIINIIWTNLKRREVIYPGLRVRGGTGNQTQADCLQSLQGQPPMFIHLSPTTCSHPQLLMLLSGLTQHKARLTPLPSDSPLGMDGWINGQMNRWTDKCTDE